MMILLIRILITQYLFIIYIILQIIIFLNISRPADMNNELTETSNGFSNILVILQAKFNIMNHS